METEINATISPSPTTTSSRVRIKATDGLVPRCIIFVGKGITVTVITAASKIELIR